MIITIVTIIINVFILLIATVFETIQYFSWNKKQLLLRKIHGYSLFSSNVRYLTISYSTFYYVSLHYAYFIWFKDITIHNNVYCYYSTFTSNCLY
ncbi:DUF1430 domain-containing protein [Staphylococcus aureus]